MPFVLARRGRVLLRCVNLVEASSTGARMAVANAPAYRSAIVFSRNLSSSSNARLFRRTIPILSKKTYATATRGAKAGGTTTSKKPVSTPAKKNAKPTKKTAKRTVKKSTKAKPKVKATPKRKQLTEKQKEALQKKKAREAIAELKAAALEPPKSLPETAYILLQQQHKQFAGISDTYKNLPSEERQRLDEIAESNRAANRAAFHDWVNRHTPLQIKEANAARRRLRRLLNKKRGFMEISDDRQPKRPANAYMHFVKEVSASGDVSTSDRMKKCAELWRSLSMSEKERYQQMALEAKNRYIYDFKSAYGTDPPTRSRSASPV
ncbi:HMG box domain-containing protein [Histoplasma ohiense]|nr:HMG box domain-containing protein [Histoplasma ohiense (nom. inval.)]